MPKVAKTVSDLLDEVGVPATPDSTAATDAGRTLRDWRTQLTSMIPPAAATAGGVLGGAAGLPVPPGAQAFSVPLGAAAGAGLGGAAGKNLELLLNRAMGMESGSVSPTPLIQEAGTQAGAELLGRGLGEIPSMVARGLPALAERFATKALRPSRGIQEAFPGTSEAMLAEGLTKSGKEGVVASRLALSRASREVDDIMAQLEGHRVPTKDVLKPLNDLWDTIELEPWYSKRAHLLVKKQWDRMISKYGDSMDPEDVLAVKRIAQRAARKLYDNAAKGASKAPQKTDLLARFNLAVARGARVGLETVSPELGMAEGKVQRLMGVNEALKARQIERVSGARPPSVAAKGLEVPLPYFALAAAASNPALAGILDPLLSSLMRGVPRATNR